MRSWIGVSRKSSAGNVILSSQSALKSIAFLLSMVALIGSSVTAAGVWLWMALIAIHFPISDTIVFHSSVVSAFGIPVLFRKSTVLFWAWCQCFWRWAVALSGAFLPL